MLAPEAPALLTQEASLSLDTENTASGQCQTGVESDQGASHRRETWNSVQSAASQSLPRPTHGQLLMVLTTLASLLGQMTISRIPRNNLNIISVLLQNWLLLGRNFINF